MQDPTLTAEMAGEIYQAYVLHGNNTSTVFCHEHQWSGDSLAIPAAARLVLRLHVFDVGGRKTGSPVSAGVIPTMDAANVLVRGNSLKETLLLNLMQYDGEEKPFEVNGEDLPAWEREPQPANAKPLGWVSEQLSAPMTYITEKPLWLALNSALQFAEQHQQVFRAFRGSPYGVLAAELNHPDASSFAKSLDGESLYWATLDREFQDLLHRQLPADKTVDGNGTTYGNQALRVWEKTVQAVATQAFTESIASIRNYQARAGALRSLNYHLAKLRGDIKEKSDKGKKPARNARPKAS
ncbi:type I-E CRISPR-associated protein Cse1/CasA [Nodosilinea sp. LEGE 07088]|nr:type I-E CRISPR-associated protein Cse1/CasA [Nodosilinea sp. LEGE 07088]